MVTLGSRVRELRLKARLSQREMAQRVGVSFPHISKVEADSEAASTELLVRIAAEVAKEGVACTSDELILLTDRIPDELREVVAAKPDLAPQFLRRWKAGKISDEQVRELIGGEGIAKDMP